MTGYLTANCLIDKELSVKVGFRQLEDKPRITALLLQSENRTYRQMKAQETDFFVRSKIWIEDSRGKVIFGLGRYRILDAVSRTGSMNAAAKELRMSYRAVWMRVRSSEKRIGKPLIAREGKGSCLTPFAESLMKQYRRLLSVVQAETDEVYQNLISDHLE